MANIIWDIWVRYILIWLLGSEMRKGLLAPQNTFLDTIAERFDGSRKFLDLGSGLNLGWRPQLGIGVSFVKIFDEKFIVKNVFLDLFRINYSLKREIFLSKKAFWVVH